MQDIKSGMVDRDFKEIRKIQLDLTRQFIEICESNQIPYYAVYGTLLGAVRHKGFIPWDDDVDLAIWRKDVGTLKRLVAAGGIREPYYLSFCDDNPDFNCGVIKFHNLNSTNMSLDYFFPDGHYGILIDIEIIDRTYNLPLLRRAKHALLDFSYELAFMKQYGETYYVCCAQSGIKKRILTILAKHMKRRAIMELADKIPQIHGVGRNYCSIYTYKQHPLLKIDWFSQGADLCFENMAIKAPLQYKQCLVQFYGKDYRCLPEKDERIPKHLYGRYIEPHLPCRRAIEQMSNWEELPTNRTFVIWGAGNMFEHYIRKFGQIRKPDFLIDNDKAKWGQMRHGCLVCSPEKLKAYRPEQLYLVICNIYVFEIIKQIKTLGDFDYTIYWEKYIDFNWSEHRRREKEET